MPNPNHAMLLGRRDAFLKIAGDLDPEALERMVSGLRRGDIINFESRSGDALQSSFREGLSHLINSAPVKAFIAHPATHTGVYAGRHPETGAPMVLHNDDGMRYDPLSSFGHRKAMQAYRIPGITDEQAGAMADRARTYYDQRAPYPLANIYASMGTSLEQRPGLGAVGRLLRKITDKFGKHCPPGESLCSYMPTEALGSVIGHDKALDIMAGGKVKPDIAPWAVSPRTLSQNLTPMTRYEPANSAGGGFVGALRGAARRLAAVIKRTPSVPIPAPSLAQKGGTPSPAM